MTRFAIFVDGSNLFGSLKNLNLEIAEYAVFFNYVLKAAASVWSGSVLRGDERVRLMRVMWYAVGTIDEWELSDEKVQGTLLEWFKKDQDVKEKYLSLAGKKLGPAAGPEAVAKEAWSLCFAELKKWYEDKRLSVEKQRNFYHGVSSSVDFLDIVQCGHLKVDLLNKTITEKGLDTFLAVDMAALIDIYDVAIVMSGDADTIPSINEIKRKGKQVGVVEFIRGYPPEKKGRESSSKLKTVADFVVPIYETELLSQSVAAKRNLSRI